MKDKIPVAEPILGKKELELVSDAVTSGWVSSIGKYIEQFECGFSKYIGIKNGLAVSNGTAALHLALVALNIRPGDEVIIPTLTFASVANVVLYCGAKPIFVDSNPDYWCIDSNKIIEKITKRTKAIIPVHLYGHPCEMENLMKIAKENELYIIEDCAEAHGAQYKGTNVGTIGDISCYSFYGNKIITTGEGGMCLTNDDELIEKMKILRDHGMRLNKKYWHDVIGFNYRMTNLQAALGVAQLEILDNFIKKRRDLAEKYNSILKEVDGIILPPEMSWAKNVYWLYSLLIKEEFGESRDELIQRLKLSGIESRPFFYPIHKMPLYNNHESHLISEELSNSGINLPSSAKLSDDEINHITDVILNNR